jgi:hypothetical protein
VKNKRLATATLLLSALLWTTMAFGDSHLLSVNAKKHFDAGVAYVDDPSGPKWEEALKEFQLAFSDSPTSRLQNNIGLCALNLERDGEAIEAYKAYLAGGGEPNLKPKQRKQIEKDITTLSASLVKVSIRSQPGELTIIDKRENAKGSVVTNLYQIKDGAIFVGMHPGRHHIRVEAPGYVASEWLIDAEPASEHSHTFKLEPEPKAEPATARLEPAKAEPAPIESQVQLEHHTPTSVYIGLAATGVFAGVATATGIVALKKSKDLDQINDRAEADSAKSSTRTWALVTDIGIGAALVSGGVTAYLYFSAPRAAQKEKAASASNVRFVPFATTNSAGGALLGSF